MFGSYLPPPPFRMLKGILTSKVMAFGDGDFGKCLGPENGALMNGMNAFIKETPESSLALFLT